MKTFGPNLKLWTSTQTEWEVSFLGQLSVVQFRIFFGLVLFTLSGCHYDLTDSKSSGKKYYVVGFGVVSFQEAEAMPEVGKAESLKTYGLQSSKSELNFGVSEVEWIRLPSNGGIFIRLNEDTDLNEVGNLLNRLNSKSVTLLSAN